MNILVTSGILNEVLAERQAQEVKHPGHVHRLPEWHLILSEEVGEVARDILELHFLRKFAGVGGPSPFKEKDILTKLRTELVQVGAVATAMIESIDNREMPSVPMAKPDREISQHNQTQSAGSSL